jgi:LacI family transcriptional regulator
LDSITLKDIATALKLSTSTVSRALRGSYEINAETKRLVTAYAEQVNYRPNPIALSLKESKSRSIGIVIPEIANNFFSEVVNAVENIAYNQGYHVVITQSQESCGREKSNLEYLAQRRVDGILVSLSSTTHDYSYFKDLQQRGLPIVFFDRVPDTIQTHKVVSDNFKGAFDATQHLLEQGYRRIAYISSAQTLSIATERFEGYRAALNTKGVAFEESYVRFCSLGGQVVEEVEQAVAELLQHPHRPDAFLTGSDKVTMISMLSIRKAHLKVPDDIALVGFTNLANSELLCPSLSVVLQSSADMGQTATRLLLELIEKPTPKPVFETHQLPTQLIVRESSIRGTL